MVQDYYGVVGGMVVPLVTQYLRTSSWFSIVKPEQKARVQAIATLLSAVSAFFVAWQTGDFSESTVNGIAQALPEVVQTLGVSALVHHWFLREKK